MAAPGKYTQPYVDTSAAPLDLAALMEAKYEEVVVILKAFRWGLLIPRRLGGDATGADLGQDKKILKKLIYAYGSVAERWVANVIPLDRADDEVTTEAQRLGAQVRFPLWIETQIGKVEADKFSMATAAIQKNDRRSANKVVACLDQESIALVRVREKFWPQP